jgi:hypothetical protein
LATPVIKNKEGPSYKCESSLDSCIYESIPNQNAPNKTPVFTVQEQCKCGLNPFGYSYCPYIYTKTFTTILGKVTEKLAHNCHTLERQNIYECLSRNIKSEEDSKLLQSFVIEKYEREQNSDIRDNDECMKKHSRVALYQDSVGSK